MNKKLTLFCVLTIVRRIGDRLRLNGDDLRCVTIRRGEKMLVTVRLASGWDSSSYYFLNGRQTMRLTLLLLTEAKTIHAEIF